VAIAKITLLRLAILIQQDMTMWLPPLVEPAGAPMFILVGLVLVVLLVDKPSMGSLNRKVR
jgi:hypothetical protein